MKIPFPLLLELCEYACNAPWIGDEHKPPSETSIERISRELGIELPPDLIAVARGCPSYGSWFARLDEDYENPLHILRLNRVFHYPDENDESTALPEHLILVNHGHDGDCDCWHIRTVGESGEHPIVYVSLDGNLETIELGFPTFRDYLEHFCRHHAPETDNRGHRKRVREILSQFPRGLP